MLRLELKEGAEDGRDRHADGGCKGLDDGPEHELKLVFKVGEEGRVWPVDGHDAERGEDDGDDAEAIHGEDFDCGRELAQRSKRLVCDLTYLC